MAIVVLKLPAVRRKTKTRPKRCPYCAGETFQRWGQVNKPVKDVKVRNIRVYRYRCCHCHRTFRHYPAGITRAAGHETIWRDVQTHAQQMQHRKHWQPIPPWVGRVPISWAGEPHNQSWSPSI